MSRVVTIKQIDNIYYIFLDKEFYDIGKSWEEIIKIMESENFMLTRLI